MDNTLKKWRNQWNLEGVRILVVTSLSIQIGLTFLAPLRKRSRNKVLALTIWLLFLTAELVPTLALGNMGKQKDPAEIGDSGTIPGDLTILWAPFLLLHLGGPDTLTSYSIDDNELWWRLPLGLVIQVGAAVYAFWQSPPNPVLWIPTTLVCIVGMIKFVEKILAIRSGSRDNMTDKIISEINPTIDAMNVGVLPEIIRNRINGIDVQSNLDKERECQDICEGYIWFDIFKRLLIDVNFSSNLLMQSQDRFTDISAKEAMNLMAIELSFLYDALHTKAIHKNCTLGRVLHCISVVSIIAALVVFHHLDMQKYASNDIIITYILFGAGLALEIIAAFLLVYSDWTVVSLGKTGWGKFIAHSITAVVKEITFRKGKSRWSRTIGQYNLVGLCLRDRDTVLAKIMRMLKIKHKWDNMRESRSTPLLPGLLEEIMFSEAKKRVQTVHVYKVFLEARTHRGNKVLEHYGLKNLEWSMKREFDECIILWHLATDMCYYYETSNQPEGNDNTEHDVSWKTSNYMVYLLTQQHSMMQLGYGKKRFEATCAVVRKKLKGKEKLKDKKARIVLLEERNKHNSWRNEVVIRKFDNVSKPGWICWGRHKGMEVKRMDEDIMGELVLEDSCRLANQLQEIEPEIKWKVISETWMEMLGFAAIHCDSHQHAKSLSRGGELLTHLWLLISQLGLVEEQKKLQFDDDFV